MIRRTSTLLAAMLFAVLPSLVLADTVYLKDGWVIEGIVKKVQKGEVTIVVGEESRAVNILDITSIDFNTPHLFGSMDGIHAEHFTGDADTEEVNKNYAELRTTSEEIRRLMDQIKVGWVARQPIDPGQEQGWEAARQSFRQPLARYQEVLNDLYFHVLAKVDEYNTLMEEARQMYVGVKGVFKTGSSLVVPEMMKLPLKKYVPGTWYDTLYYEGYQMGYDDAYDKCRARD